MNKNSNKRGVCLHCGSEDIDYDAIEFEGDYAYYPYKCNKCGFEGEEWYKLEFVENQEK